MATTTKGRASESVAARKVVDAALTKQKEVLIGRLLLQSQFTRAELNGKSLAWLKKLAASLNVRVPAVEFPKNNRLTLLTAPPTWSPAAEKAKSQAKCGCTSKPMTAGRRRDGLKLLVAPSTYPGTK